MGRQPAEQVVLVIGTGSGKTMVVMIGAAIADAGTTILVLPMSASLVIVSAEAACTQGFLEYCHLQVSKQKLDRIVIDESHLTITASDYRPCMAQLGWPVYPTTLEIFSPSSLQSPSLNQLTTPELSSASSPPTFALFATLPQEIMLKIWGMALAEPVHITFEYINPAQEQIVKAVKEEFDGNYLESPGHHPPVDESQKRLRVTPCSG
ncbi:hypothetical protein IFR05_017185, partial [Cadophora sp. M221]